MLADFHICCFVIFFTNQLAHNKRGKCIGSLEGDRIFTAALFRSSKLVGASLETKANTSFLQDIEISKYP